ncbi:cytochrome P450 [Phlyctema vagabunda]|uniref:Cytochrome P450 n=1 Tax=Phlyctema vagabunda TaxID=108571 RepID=A0ABR4PHN2_9HELO
MAHIDSNFKSIQGGTSTFSTLFLGSRVIYTIEPENVKAIFATNFRDYGQTKTRKDALAIFGPGIFTVDGHQWEASRALLRPNFVRNLVGDMSAFETHVLKMLEKIPGCGRVIDMQELFLHLTMDSATELLLGESTGLLGDRPKPEAVRFMQAFSFVSGRLSVRMGIGWLATIIPDMKFHRGIDDMKSFVNIYVSRALDMQRKSITATKDKVNATQKEEDRYVFLPHLAQSGYDQKRIGAELMAVIVAGGGSTSSLLTMFWFTIARHPDVFLKLRDEVLRTIGNRPPSFEELKDLRYLSWTMRELQRMYPVIPVNSRVAVKDSILPLGGGIDGKSPVFVKKGTQILHFPYSMHRRKDIYGPDADDWEYLPFSGGPRSCIGQQLALTEASYTTVRLIQTFKNVRPGDNTAWAEKLVLSMSVKSGCNLIFTPA